MKHEEAIEFLKGFYLNDCESDIFLPCYLCENPCEEGQKILLAIEALEKQIPKKPIDISKKENGRHIMICPNCQRTFCNNDGFGRYEPKYCEKCGQKLDWRVEE